MNTAVSHDQCADNTEEDPPGSCRRLKRVPIAVDSLQTMFSGDVDSCPESPALDLALRALATVAVDLNTLALAVDYGAERPEVTRALIIAAGRLASACDIAFEIRRSSQVAGGEVSEAPSSVGGVA